MRARVARLEAERDHANMVADAGAKKVKELEADKARLDWLDSANEEMNLRTGTHYGWRFDWNGNRVAILSDMHLPPLSVREALDNAMGAARTAATRKDGA